MCWVLAVWGCCVRVVLVFDLILCLVTFVAGLLLILLICLFGGFVKMI